MKFISLEALQNFPIRLNHYDQKNGSLDFVSGIETVIKYAENMAVDFDIDRVLEQLEEQIVKGGGIGKVLRDSAAHVYIVNEEDIEEFSVSKEFIDECKAVAERYRKRTVRV